MNRSIPSFHGLVSAGPAVDWRRVLVALAHATSGRPRLCALWILLGIAVATLIAPGQLPVPSLASQLIGNTWVNPAIEPAFILIFAGGLLLVALRSVPLRGSIDGGAS